MAARGISRRNIIKLIVLFGIVLAGYSLNTVITYYIFNQQYQDIDRSRYLTDVEENIVEPVEIFIDYSQFLDELLNSDLFDQMSELEKAEFLADLFGDNISEFMDLEDLTPEEFLEVYGEELGEMMESLSGDSFSSDLFDELDPALLAVLLAKPMFYAYESNPTTNPWSPTDSEDTLFKINAFDTYNLGTTDWEFGTLANEGVYYGDESLEYEKWFIKYETMVATNTLASIPTTSPTPMISAASLESDPLFATSSISMKTQAYLGGTLLEASFDITDQTSMTNLTYELLYDGATHPDASYYQNLNLDMGDYTATNDPTVTACLYGPLTGEGGTFLTWNEYSTTQSSNFATINGELQVYVDFTSATNTYDQMNAITQYIGENFALNVYGGSRPGDTDEPIDWFCGVKESQYSFEFSYLATALARANGIPARYVSGYKYNSDLADQLGWGYSDPTEGGDISYAYRVGNMYSWMEVFVPTSSSSGDWVAFDNQFSLTPQLPNTEDIELNLQFDGDWLPATGGYDRFYGEFNEPTQLNLTMLYTLYDQPMQHQQVDIYDVTYNQAIGTVYTDTDGKAESILDLGTMIPGAHVLQYTVDYLGYEFGNVTVINIVDDIELYQTANETIILTPPQTDEDVFINGYAWDPVLELPVKNVMLTYTGLQHPTLSDPIPANPFFTDYGDTNSTGNFSITATVPGYPLADSSRNYSLFSIYNATYDVTDDILSVDPIYQALFASIFGAPGFLQQFGDYATYTLNASSGVQLKDDDYFEFTFGVDTSFADKITPATYPSGPSYGLRSGSFTLNFTATTWEGSDWSGGQNITIYDESEANRTVTSFTTDVNGYGSQIFDVSADAVGNLDNWTAGPHLLRMEWDRTGISFRKFWVFIEAPVALDMSTEYYLNGKAGIALNRYHIDNRSIGDADIFTMAGNLTDVDTGEIIHDYRVYYELFDNAWNLLTLTIVSNGTTDEYVPTGNFTEDFTFAGSVPVSLGPISTNADFTGEWGGLADGWDNAWNTLWMPYFAGLANQNDSSDGDMILSDPTDFTLLAWLNGTDITVWNDNPLILNDTLIISSRFFHDGLPIAGAELILYANSTKLFNITTGVDGWANFPPFLWNSSILPGTYNISVVATYKSLSLTFTETRHLDQWVVFDPANGFTVTDRINGTLISSFGGDYPGIWGLGDQFDFSAWIYHNESLGTIYNIQDATVYLSVNGALQYTGSTDALGYDAFTFIFNNTHIAGTKVFNLTIVYHGAAFDLPFTSLLNVEYDPLLHYTADYSINFADFEVFPSYIYTDVIGPDDVIYITCTILHNGIPVPGVNVSLTDTNGPSLWVWTDGAGNANFSITFIYGVANDGSHGYNVSFKHDDGAYSFSNHSQITVVYDQDLRHQFNTWINGVQFYEGVFPTTLGANDTIVFTAQFLYDNGTGYEPQEGRTIYLKDIINGSFSRFNTTVNGNVTFTFTFDEWTTVRLHKFNLSITDNDAMYAYIIQESRLMDVNFDPEVKYQLNPQIEFTAFDVYSSYEYDVTQNLSDSVHISCWFTYDHFGISPVAGEQVILTYLDNGSISFQETTSAAGYANFTVLFDNTMLAGWHRFNVSLTYTDSYGFPITLDALIKVEYDPTEGYAMVSRINGNDFEVYSSSSYEYDIVQILNDQALISFFYHHLWVPVQGAKVVLSCANGTDLTLYTDSNGYVNFTILFDKFFPEGLNWFTAALSLTDGSYSVYANAQIGLTYDPQQGYDFIPRVENGSGIVTEAQYNYPVVQIWQDTLQLSFNFNWFGSNLVGVDARLEDVAHSINQTDTTDTSGNANFTVTFTDTMASGYYYFNMSLSFTNGTYSYSNYTIIRVFYNPTANFVFTPMVDGSSSFSLLTYEVKATGEFVNISYQILHDGSGLAGADITVTDLVNGSIWSTTTGASGTGYILLYYTATTHMGAHRYDISIDYTFGLYAVGDSKDSIWVIYKDPVPLAIAASRQNYANNFTVSNDGPDIEIAGTLVAPGTSNGYYNATIHVWIYDPSNVEIIGSFTVVVNYYNDYTDGAFSVTISQLGSASLTTGNYSIEIGFDGNVLDGPTTYRYIPDIRVNLTTRIAFSVYDTPVLTTSWSMDNHGEIYDFIIPGFTNITINGSLTYSNGTGVAFEYVTITLYDEYGAVIVANTIVQTNANGEFEWTFLVEEGWNLDYYIISYDGDWVIYLNPADDVQETVV
jgi:hypothetical protein